MRTQAKRTNKWNNKVHFILHVVFKTDSFLLFIPERLPVIEPQCFSSHSGKNHLCESRPTTLKRTSIKNVMHSLCTKNCSEWLPTEHVFLQRMSFNVLFSCTSPFFTHRSVHGICHAHSNRKPPGLSRKWHLSPLPESENDAQIFLKFFRQTVFLLKPIPSAQADICEPIAT